ncbi:2-oxoisovalerate dehydrogenase subunit beta [Cupriavidus basilensis OR16]|uniref:2-oxoisovalerate dehydrogenase subunit beta n=1 Tax=Cupriavidus basilensis OR16 TaxID=1127483 RepID=H1S2I2_9BURK|nr:alpha-ketoacid dehydrogenase subunit alpha/beta [Cupriavidus basilensis]EHP43230.1 2-oxoisovalerate dehydrogenase subunit beta [Cupriavidus basilensis OR16]
MSERNALRPAAEWVELRTTDEDWAKADPALLGTLLSHLHLIRGFEEAVLELAAEGLVHGPAHSSIGQEGGAAGSIVSLTGADQINGSHRGHHQFISKALGYLAPNGIDPRAPLSADVQTLLQRTLAEILGLAQGYCKGRGGSMHLQWAEAGALGTNAIVGGGVPMAAGAAWSHRHAGTDAVAITYFGDGAVNIGSVLETMNLAAAWKLPLCFFIENNRYAVSTTVEESTAEPRLSARGMGFNIPSWKVDGMDPLAVYLATQEALAHMRAGKGPTVIEADLYRFFHQNGPFPGSAFGYRTKEEEQQWRARDPLELMARRMQERGLISADDIAALRERIKQGMRDAMAALTEADPSGKPGRRRIRPELWPSPDFRDVGVRGDLSELEGLRCEDEAGFSGKLDKRKFIDVVADVMHRRMETDRSVVVMGEDVHRLKGGTNGATRGLRDTFPDRVLGTPISENAFVGLGGGLALDGRYKPVVEFMYPDFMWVAADQVFNQIGKARHMFGGESDVPLVLRTKVAMGTGYGSQHSMDPAGIFATNPGWRIVAPSTPFDYVGLMNTALACKDPVLVIEHVDLYNASGVGPVDDFDYHLPVGKAAVRRNGSDVTVITYLSMVAHSLEAVEQTGIDAEVIDLRWLDRASLDWDTIEQSIRKTNNVLIAEQGARGTSYGGWLADEIQRRYFDWLDQPVQRVTGAEAAPSISKVLERAAAARTEEVVEGLRQVMREKGAT